MKKKSREDWFRAALQLLETTGVESITITNLARKLKISRSGFYWHFKDRRDLLQQLLRYWSHEYTEIITNNPMIMKAESNKKLIRIAETILEYDLTRFELQFRLWAAQDHLVAKEVERVYGIRMAFLKSVFQDLGFEGEELELRTRLFLCYHTWEGVMYWKTSEKEMKKMMISIIKLLVKK